MSLYLETLALVLLVVLVPLVGLAEAGWFALLSMTSFCTDDELEGKVGVDSDMVGDWCVVFDII